MISGRSYLLLFILLIFISPVVAGTKQWTGAVNTAWNVGGNWSGNSVPGNGDNILIPGGLVNYPVASTNISIKNITVNSSGSGGRLTVSANTLSAARLYVEAGGLLIITGGALQVSEVNVDGTISVSGMLGFTSEFQVNNGGTVNQAGGTVHANSTLTGTPKTDIVINAGGVYNQAGGTFSVRDLLAGAGTFNQSGPSAIFRIYRHWKMGAGSTFNSTSGTVQFFGNGMQSDFASGTVQFSNVVINAGVNPGFSNVTGSTVFISGNFTNNNTALSNTANATFIFNGNQDQNIYSAAASAATFGNIEVNKGGGELTLSSNIFTSGNITIINGVVDMLSFQMNRIIPGGQLIMSDGYLMVRGSTGGVTGSNFPLNFTTVNLSSASTVSYSGNSQVIAPVVYGNLDLSGASGSVSKSMNALALVISGNLHIFKGNSSSLSFNISESVSIDGNCTVESGTTLNSGVYNLFARGDFLCAGTYTSSGRLILNGTVNQNINVNNAVFKLTIDNSSGNVTLQSGITVNDTLLFVKGKIITGLFTVNIAATGTVVGASQSTGWVYGLLNRYVAPGNNISCSFDIGDNNFYSPVIFTLDNVSAPGTVTAISITGDHPFIGGSLVNPARSVNRYWKFTNNGVAYTNGTFMLNWNDADMDPGCDPLGFSTAVFLAVWDTVASWNHTTTSLQAGPIFLFPDIVIGEVCHPADMGTWTGIAGSGVLDAYNWKCGIVPDATMDVLIPAAALNQPEISSGVLEVNNITIETGATLLITGGTLEVAGTISGPGIINASAGILGLTGINPQQIPPGIFINNALNSLVINNSAGVSLAGMITVRDMLKIESGVLQTNGMLTLASDATQTAYVDGSGSGSITGQVTMQRYLPSGFGYKYISSPFESATISSLSDEIDLNSDFPMVFRYDESRASSGWVSYTDPLSMMIPMTGYGVNFGSIASPVTVDITGELNNGVQSLSLWNTNQPYTTGFNLVGNPYPSPINWDATSGWVRTNIDDAIYFFDASSSDQYGGTYSTYINGISSDGIAGNIIPSMQGFFVHVSDGTYPVSATLQIDNSARATGFQPYYHKAAQSNERQLIRLEAGFSSSQRNDVAVIYFDDQSEFFFESNMDARKLMNTADHIPDIYTLSEEGIPLAINAAGSLNQEYIIPLGIEVNKNEHLHIRCTEIKNIPVDMNVYLSDKRHINRDLRMNPEYIIELDKGTYQNRFSIIVTGEELPPVKDNEYYGIYSYDGVLFVSNSSEYAKFILRAADGRMVLSRYLQSGMHEINTALAEGFYIATFLGPESVFSKKLFIKGS